jgi:mRNA interferase MazF
MTMRRGDLVTVAFPGDYGKPRPALIVQSDAFSEMASVTVLPLTSDLRPAPLVRITIEPSRRNGLARRSQIMIDKAATVQRTKVGARIGRIEPEIMRASEAALGRFLGLA